LKASRQYARNLTPLENHYPEISRSFSPLQDSTITKFFAIALFFLEQKYLFFLNIVLLRILKNIFSD
jgi:hypothetical protein